MKKKLFLNPLILLICICGSYSAVRADILPESLDLKRFPSKVMDKSLVEVDGTVTDKNNEPLVGVSVVVKGHLTGTNTDSEGKFRLTNVTEKAVLVFSYIGYHTQEIPIGNRSTFNITLEESLKTLDEVVVVGYGEQSRETLTSAVTKLDNKVIENTIFANATSALQGTVSGVQVKTASGQPGAAPSVIVRGGTSINNPDGAQPLYVVDGVIRPTLDGINSADISSMQVLKDAAATAIYGARASNGVVIVSLKKGVAGRTTVNYNYSLGFSQLREKYDVLSAKDFVYFGRLGAVAAAQKIPGRLALLDQPGPFGTGNDLTKNTTYTTQYLTDDNKYKLDEGWESIPDPIDPSKTIIFKNTDWQDVMFRTGVTHDHHLSLAGGDEKATFNLGVGYTTIQGTAINTSNRRLTANLGGRLNISNNLYAYGSLNFSRLSDNTVFSENNLFERSLALPPTTKYRFEDGTLAPGSARTLGNAEYHLGRYDNKNQENLMTLSGGFNWQILPGFTFEPSASLFYKVSDSRSFQKSYFDSPTAFVDSRSASGYYGKWDQQQFEGVFSYVKTFDDRHNFQAKAGASYYGRVSSGLSASGQGAATDLIPTLNASAIPSSVSSTSTEQVIMGYFGRITYDFDRRYLFTLNARYDGASNLGKKNQWGFFPGVSAGWNLHNEEFWQEQPLVKSLKLRASYGVNGNLGSLSDFQAQGVYGVGATYDGVAAVEYNTLANQDLKWEESRTVDFGLDAGLFNNRIHLIFDYYHRVTHNLITTLSLPNLTGFSNILTNLGSLENRGVELELGANVIQNKEVNWNLSFNASRNQNKILRLPENQNENNRVGGLFIYDPAIGDYAWRGGLQEGGRIGELYGYQFTKVYATDEEAQAGPVDQLVSGADKTKFGGDVAWQDVDGNDIIDTRDKVYMGNIYPKWTGGFTSTVSYKGLSLYARMDYTVGHTIYNYVRANMDGYFVSFGINGTSDILRSWQNQGDVTDVPRYYYNDISVNTNYWRGDPRNSANGNGNSQNYEKADYLAVRELTLTYEVPTVVYKRIGLRDLRVNVTGNNLKYFTKYKGLSPESGGTDRGRYPLPRVITFGIKTSF